MASRRPLHELALRIERIWERLRARFRRPPTKLTVAMYLGHGTARRVAVGGRVLENDVVVEADVLEPAWLRFRRMAARFLTSEVAGVPVRVGLGGATVDTVTDDEGYFAAIITDPTLPHERGGLHDLTVDLLPPFDRLDVHVTSAQVLVPCPSSRRIVISDIDDTILLTGAMRTGQMILTTLAGSALTRRSFPGTAALYRGLAGGPSGDEDNPCFYVSSSPWNLYDFLVAFIRRSSLPTGPLLLRDLGVDEHRFVKGSHGEHKDAAIEAILLAHDLPVVLVGDTGQHDPEIYRAVVDAHPGRVEAVLLRHVADDARRAVVERLFDGAATVVAIGDDSPALAAVAERAGLVPAGWSAEVAGAD